MWGRARAGSRRADGGAVAVEAALVLPLIFLLTFGIMEFALLLRDYVGASNVVRDAARVASAAPRQGNVAGHAGPPPPASAVESFAYKASQVITTTGTAIPERSIRDLWVYQAGSDGLPLSGGFTSCPAASCVRYSWEDPDGAGPMDGSFGYRSGSWNPASINACPGDPNAMAVGVFLRVEHRALFGALFGAGMMVTDHSVIKFEPLRPGAGSCKP